MKKLFFLLSLSAIFSWSVSATTITVITNDGGNDEGTLRQVFSDAADGDVIEFNLPSGDVIELAGSLSRTKGSTTITINGINQATNKPVILSGMNERSIYRSNSGEGASTTNINFNDLVFKNGFQTGDGGAFSFGNSAHKTISAIHFKNCSFEDCAVIANGSGNSNARGGALAINQFTDIIVENCTFANNEVRGNASGTGNNWGGAVATLSSSNINAKFINCTFYKNKLTVSPTVTATVGGGAIYFHPTTATSIINCTFVENEASGTSLTYGGAVFANSNGVNTMVNCLSTGNIPDDGYGKRLNLNYCIVQQIGEVVNASENLITYNPDIYKGGSPMLDANGGVTKTIAITFSGVACQGGSASVEGFTIPATDQRGVSRLTPPSIGAYDNPNYVFAGFKNPVKQSLNAWAEGKQIHIYTENPGWATVYGLAGQVIGKTYISNNNTLSAVGSGVYTVRFIDNAGNASVAKVIVK